MLTRLLITTKPALLTVCSLGIGLCALIAIAGDDPVEQPPTVVTVEEPPPVARRAAIPTPEVPFVAEALSVEQYVEQSARDDREKTRYLADCRDRGGRSCCGQGGCCGVPDTVLGARLDTNMPFVFGELSTAVVERRLNAQAAALTTCYTRESIEPGGLDYVFVELQIGRDGRVAKSSASGFDERVASCVARVLGAMRFPRPAHGTVEVRTSFEFHDAT